MVKFMVMFFKPGDLEAFENTYNDFLALVERMPGIRRRQVVGVLGSPMGETRYYRILEVYYENYEQLQESLTSPQGQEAGRELGRLGTEAFEMLFAEVYEEEGGQTKSD